MNMKAALKSSIVAPQMVGGDHFHIGKTLDGGYVFSINNQSMRMSPQQVHDLACRLLNSLGIQVEIAERPAVLPGPKLVG